MKRPDFLNTPLILAPIAGPGTPDLTAAACEAGAFGILGSSYSTPEQMRRDAAHVRSLTSKPFGVNLFIDPPPAPIDSSALHAAHKRLRPYYDELGLMLPPEPTLPSDHFAAQLEALLEIRPAVFSFTFGIPHPDIVSAIRNAGIYMIGTATTVEEAVALEAAGVDAVCAQGMEAGGHRGTFLVVPSRALIGTLALVPQIVDAVNVPVMAAGGITDGRGLAAVLALGAVAAQCGTAFLLAQEARTSAPYRTALENAYNEETILTTAFSGRLARGIPNRFAIEMNDPQSHASYPYQNALTRDLRTRAAQAGNAELLSLWAGQAFRLAKAGTAADIVRRILGDAVHAAKGTVEGLGGS